MFTIAKLIYNSSLHQSPAIDSSLRYKEEMLKQEEEAIKRKEHSVSMDLEKRKRELQAKEAALKDL
jgi:hypothetical protein